jgi:hypothetical protein
MKFLFILFFVSSIATAGLAPLSETSGRVVAFDSKTVTLLNNYGKMKILKSDLSKQDLAKIKSGSYVTLIIPTPKFK